MKDENNVRTRVDTALARAMLEVERLTPTRSYEDLYERVADTRLEEHLAEKGADGKRSFLTITLWMAFALLSLGLSATLSLNYPDSDPGIFIFCCGLSMGAGAIAACCAIESVHRTPWYRRRVIHEEQARLMGLPAAEKRTMVDEWIERRTKELRGRMVGPDGFMTTARAELEAQEKKLACTKSLIRIEIKGGADESGFANMITLIDANLDAVREEVRYVDHCSEKVVLLIEDLEYRHRMMVSAAGVSIEGVASMSTQTEQMVHRIRMGLADALSETILVAQQLQEELEVRNRTITVDATVVDTMTEDETAFMERYLTNEGAKTASA